MQLVIRSAFIFSSLVNSNVEKSKLINIKKKSENDIEIFSEADAKNHLKETIKTFSVIVLGLALIALTVRAVNFLELIVDNKNVLDFIHTIQF